MTRYRTMASRKGDTFVTYHGISFEMASRSWHTSVWADDKVIEVWTGDRWKTVMRMSQDLS